MRNLAKAFCLLLLFPALAYGQVAKPKVVTRTTPKPLGTPVSAAATVTHDVILTWVQGTVPTGAPAINGNNIYRGTTAGSEVLLATLTPNTTYTDSAVSGNTTYFYVVTATSTAGESGKSNEVNVAIPNTVPPNPPTGLVVTSSQ